jgi:hypothetical protein
MPRTLGIGVYDGGQLVPMVRQSFLHTIRKSAPQVLEELRDETLSLFLTAKREPVANIPRRTKPQAEQLRKKIIKGAIESSEISLVRQDFEEGEFKLDKQVSAFLQSLFDWSKRWNLNADWCLFRAFKTLHSWSRHQSYVEDLQWSTLLFGLDDPEGEPLPPEGFPAWNVFEDSRRAFQKMIEDSARNRLINDPLLSKIESSHREDFLRELKPIVKKYQDRVESFYDKKGFERIKRQELIKHIEWTVDFQVSQMRFREIANNSDVEPQAVTKAVKFILKLIDLKQRSAPAGRPSGSKDSGTRHIAKKHL